MKENSSIIWYSLNSAERKCGEECINLILYLSQGGRDPTLPTPPTVFFPHPNSIKLYGYIPQNFTLTLKPFCKTFSFLLTFLLSLFIKLPYFMNHNLDKRNLCKFDFSIKEYIFFVYTAHWEPENSGNRKTTLQQ